MKNFLLRRFISQILVTFREHRTRNETPQAKRQWKRSKKSKPQERKSEEGKNHARTRSMGPREQSATIKYGWVLAIKPRRESSWRILRQKRID